jgi:predicted acetyltransferase
MLRVSQPDNALQAAFWRMLDDYAAGGPRSAEFYAAARADFLAYVQSLLDEEQGINLPPGYVPCSHRWLVDDGGEVVGVVRVRHNISTEFLANEAGHIGYDVPPSYRRRGYGIACLQAGLARARELGLERVLVCADADNPASWRTIERCGGILEAERYSPHYKTLSRRYWIDLAP